MNSASASGAKASKRERNGRGRMPSFFIIQPHRSCKATRWQPQPQKNRPSTSVLSRATRKNTKPAFS